MFEIDNRGLNEVALYLKAIGFDIIAKEDIVPIVVRTAEKRQKIAVISCPKIISTITFVIKKMEEDDRYQISRHLQNLRKKVANPERKGRKGRKERKEIIAV